MDELERVVTESLQRINNFGQENAAAVAGNAKAAAAFAAIADYVGELDEKGALRTSANAEKLTQTGFRRMKRSELYSYLLWMSRNARDIAKNNAAFVNKFRIPRQNLNDSIILEAARAFYADSEAEAVENAFIDYGFPNDFRADLDALIDEFDGAINAQDAALRERVASNAEIDDIVDRALDGRRTLLVIIPNIFQGNAGKLADWASASYIEKLPKSKKTPPSPEQ